MCLGHRACLPRRGFSASAAASFGSFGCLSPVQFGLGFRISILRRKPFQTSKLQALCALQGPSRLSSDKPRQLSINLFSPIHLLFPHLDPGSPTYSKALKPSHPKHDVRNLSKQDMQRSSSKNADQHPTLPNPEPETSNIRSLCSRSSFSRLIASLVPRVFRFFCLGPFGIRGIRIPGFWASVRASAGFLKL